MRGAWQTVSCQQPLQLHQHKRHVGLQATPAGQGNEARQPLGELPAQQQDPAQVSLSLPCAPPLQLPVSLRLYMLAFWWIPCHSQFRSCLASDAFRMCTQHLLCGQSEPAGSHKPVFQHDGQQHCIGRLPDSSMRVRLVDFLLQ